MINITREEDTQNLRLRDEIQIFGITVFGQGRQTRSFCYVDDMIEGIHRMMNNQQNFRGPVNLGNPDEVSIQELAELVIQLTGSKSQIVFKPLPEEDPAQRRPDIDLAYRELGWAPTVDLGEGLKRTIEYFEDFLSKNSLQPLIVIEKIAHLALARILLTPLPLICYPSKT